MLHFDLEPWEFFQAPTGPDGPMVTITHVWIDGSKIMGSTDDASSRPVWLHPNRVPGRVIRRDNSKPKHHLEWREIVTRGKTQIVLDADEKLAAKLAAVPPPRVPARAARMEEIPQGARTVGVRATAAGFDLDVRYSEGPRFDQYWNVVEISKSIMIRGKHADGRRFGAMWMTKTGQSGKQAGVVKWGLETSYLLREGLWTACNATELAAYCQQQLINH